MPAFDLITDLASAVYLWGALLDAMAEHDGAPVGLAAIRSLLDGSEEQTPSASAESTAPEAAPPTDSSGQDAPSS